MRSSPFPCVHHSFTVRVLAPLMRQAQERHVSLQAFLRRGVANVLRQSDQRRALESWRQAAILLAREVRDAQPSAKQRERGFGL